MSQLVENESPAARPLPSKGRRAAVRWGRLCCGAAFVVFVLAEAVGGVWPFVLLTPHTPQWALIGAIGLLLLVVPAWDKPSRRMSALFRLAGLLAVLWGTLIVNGRIPSRTVPPAARVTADDANYGRVKVFAANVHTTNADHRTVLEVIAEEDPDVILLPEVSDAWMDDLKVLNEKYPVRTAMPDSLGNFGMAFWSRLPGEAAWTVMKKAGQQSEDDVPQIDATLRLTDAAGQMHSIRFIGLHPLPPIGPNYKRARDAVLTETGDTIAKDPSNPTIVAGDLNATRYCRVMQRMVRSSGLRDAAAPLWFSWPNTWSWWAMGIRIDHTLVTDQWRVVDAHVGRDIHSDHVPIVTTLQLVRTDN